MCPSISLYHIITFSFSCLLIMSPLAVHAQVTMCSITCALVSSSQIGVVGLTVHHRRASGWWNYGWPSWTLIFGNVKCLCPSFRVYGACYAGLYRMYRLDFEQYGWHWNSFVFEVAIDYNIGYFKLGITIPETQQIIAQKWLSCSRIHYSHNDKYSFT